MTDRTSFLVWLQNVGQSADCVHDFLEKVNCEEKVSRWQQKYGENNIRKVKNEVGAMKRV